MAADSTRLRVPIDWKLPVAVARRLGDRSGRQRAMSAEGHLLLVLHEPPVPGMSERIGRLFWRDPAGNWRSSSHGTGIQALMEHLTEYADRVDRLEKELENADNADDYYSLLREVAPLHRSVRNLHATLQQAREMVAEDADLINARDQAGEFERALDLVHSDAAHGLDYTIARHAEHQAEAAYQMSVAGYRLNLLAAAFFPIATIGAAFGMNLPHGFENPKYSGIFWLLLTIGLISGIALTVMIARKPSRDGVNKRPPKLGSNLKSSRGTAKRSFK